MKIDGLEVPDSVLKSASKPAKGKPFYKYLANELLVVFICLLIFAFTLLPLLVLEVWFEWPKHTGIITWLVLWVLLQAWRGWKRQA